MIKRNLTPLLIATVATRTHRRRLLASGSAIRRRDVETISPRNRALLRLLFDRGLRVGEVVHLDLADLDKHAAELWVLGKGRTTNNGWPYQSRRWQRCGTGSATVAPGQGRWSVSFSSFGAKDHRLVTRGAYRIIRNLGASGGVHLHPHQLRHSAITQAVEAATAGATLPGSGTRFQPTQAGPTLLIYRDELENRQSMIALVAGKARGPQTR